MATETNIQTDGAALHLKSAAEYPAVRVSIGHRALHAAAPSDDVLIGMEPS
jgi:carbonic anhydrase/acetyltransferase-like protein (isoleucine patch superfamily)